MQAEAEAVEGLGRATGPVGGLGESAELGGQVPEGSGGEGVDPALPDAAGRDDAGALEGLEVLRRLGLAGPGQLGEDAHRARSLGQQADQPPAGRIGERGEEQIHGHHHSLNRIFLSRNAFLPPQR